MPTEISILREAIEAVSREQSMLRKEISRWEEFREEVRLANPGRGDTDENTSQTENIVVGYRDTVMSTPGFEDVYDESLEESLEHEFPPTLADILISRKPLTQRGKRKLLVATNSAIARREEFLGVLESERNILEGTADDIETIRERAAAAPSSSLDQSGFCEVLEATEAYDELENQCESLLEKRQRDLEESAWSPLIEDENHVLNLYIYEDLDTMYPLLSAIAETCRQIRSFRDSSCRPDRVT